ncbi:CapA family protein [Romboutsia sp.]|uniref:CapA family protein n=1 Tax=Romboutsia sp. TaxID=1965302 RepID=UPI003F316DF5
MSRSKRNKSVRKKNKSKLYKLLIFLILLVTFGIFFTLWILGKSIASFYDFSPNNDKENEKAISTMSSPPRSSKVYLNVVGDIMAHSPQLKAQYDSANNSYSFDNNFKYVKSYMEKADLSIANLETTLAGPEIPYTSYPSFNSPDALADALKYAGVDVVSTINNHSFDKGDLGVDRTLQVLKEKGFNTVGTVQNSQDNNYIIKDINSIKLGITSFSYGELKGNSKFVNGIQISSKSKDKMNVFDMYNPSVAFNTINQTLKEIEGTDLQIVVLHWGNEYQRVPSYFQNTLAKMLCNSGVDIIIGSHPHVVQPVEMITSTNGENQTLVIYSLGNFLSNQRREILGSPYTEDGLMIEIEISKKPIENQARVSSVNCIPTWVNKYQISGKDTYEIVPIIDKDTLLKMNNLPLDTIKNSYNNTASQVKESNIIKISPNPFS